MNKLEEDKPLTDKFYKWEVELWDADPNCKHDIKTLDSGVKCMKCNGWLCL